jgi:hypothetical protein
LVAANVKQQFALAVQRQQPIKKVKVENVSAQNVEVIWEAQASLVN